MSRSLRLHLEMVECDGGRHPLVQCVVDGAVGEVLVVREPWCGSRLRMRRNPFPSNWDGCLHGAAFARGVLAAREVAEREKVEMACGSDCACK